MKLFGRRSLVGGLTEGVATNSRCFEVERVGHSYVELRSWSRQTSGGLRTNIATTVSQAAGRGSVTTPRKKPKSGDSGYECDDRRYRASSARVGAFF